MMKAFYESKRLTVKDCYNPFFIKTQAEQLLIKQARVGFFF